MNERLTLEVSETPATTYVTQAKINGKWLTVYPSDYDGTLETSREFAAEYATGEDALIETRVVKITVMMEVVE